MERPDNRCVVLLFSLWSQMYEDEHSLNKGRLLRNCLEVMSTTVLIVSFLPLDEAIASRKVIIIDRIRVGRVSGNASEAS